MHFKILRIFNAVMLLCYCFVEGKIPEVTADGCSVTKSCIKIPERCTGQSDCDTFLSWNPVSQNGKRYAEIEMIGKLKSNKGYVAIGFGVQNRMNVSGVLGCYIERAGSALQFRAGFNINHNSAYVPYSADFLIASGPGSEDKLGGFFIASTKTIVCRIRRLLRPSYNVEMLMDLSPSKKHYILSARGSEIRKTGLGMHFATSVSDKPYDVGAGNASIVQISSDLAIKGHGVLMMVAWLLCASISVVVARYIKPMRPDSTIFGLKMWFQIHRIAQMLTVFLSVFAIVIIFARVGGYSQLTTLPDLTHPILGIIVMVLAIVNPIAALLCPLPNSPKSVLVNWAHFSFGSLAQILSLAAMFTGVKLPKNGEKFSSSPYPFWILVGYVIFTVFMEMAFVLNQYFLHHASKKTQHPIVDDDRSNIYIDDDDEKHLIENSVSVRQGHRLLLLVVYCIGVTGFTFSLVTLLLTN